MFLFLLIKLDKFLLLFLNSKRFLQEKKFFLFFFLFTLAFFLLPKNKIYALAPCSEPMNSCKVADINNDNWTNALDFSILNSCFGCTPWKCNWLFCGRADINRDGEVDIFDFARLSSCYWLNFSSCQPSPTPALIPPVSIKVSGYVKDTGGRPIVGARVLVHKTDSKYGPCNGTHWGCNPGTAITNSLGQWISTCSDGPMLSILVKETQNAAGYVDGKYPEPAGGAIWDKNTVCLENTVGKYSFSPVTFYDSLEK